MVLFAKEIESILYCDYKELFDKLFEPNGFSNTEEWEIDELDNIEKDDPEGFIPMYKKFGCIIKDDGRIILPANSKFSIIRKSHSGDPANFYIKNNGEEIEYIMWDDKENIGVTLTKFGEKLLKYADNDFYDIIEAYKSLQKIDKIFGTNLTND